MPETTLREARCTCGDLRLETTGEPELVSSCCCTRCQRRTGAFFGVTAYFRPARVAAPRGASTTWRHPGSTAAFRFCPRCGSTVWWTFDDDPSVVGVAGGCFADQTLPSPRRMVHTRNRHPFVRTPEGLPLHEDAPE